MLPSNASPCGVKRCEVLIVRGHDRAVLPNGEFELNGIGDPTIASFIGRENIDAKRPQRRDESKRTRILVEVEPTRH